MNESEDRVYGRLRLFNAAMGALHLLQGLAMLLLSSSITLPLRTTFLDSSGPPGSSVSTVTRTVFDLRLGPLVAAFLLISSVAHFVLASPPVFPWYVRNLKRHINYARWYEYAASASVMIVVIAMLCGVFDLPTLVLLFSLNATMIFFGLMMELHNQTTERTNWTSFVMGCFAGGVPWVIIIWYFIGAVLTSHDGNVPGFVYGIIASLFVFFNVFAVNMFLQYKRVGPWRDYLFGERGYILLSLFAKSALAWQVFFGTRG
jgi:hypothetical protein